MPRPLYKDKLQLELNKILIAKAKNKIRHSTALQKLELLKEDVRKEKKNKTKLQLINKYKKIINSFTK